MLLTTTSSEGLRLLSQGDIKGAKDIFAILIANKEDLAQANYGLGVIALQESDPSEARERFEACLWHDSQHSNALFQLGYIEKQSGNDDEAVEYWQRCLKANQTHAGAMRELQAIGALRPEAPPLSPSPQIGNGVTTDAAIGGYDLYGMLKRCNSGIELEIVRLLDEVQAMMVSKKQRIRAFIGPFLLFWAVGLVAVFILAQQRIQMPVMLARVVATLVLLITLARMLEIKCNKIDCQRYIFTQTKGVFATHSRNDYLWLMSQNPMLVKRSLFNRLTNDGSLSIGGYRFKGFFSNRELRTIQNNFAQLTVLNPTNREVLAVIGELKQMRTGDK